MNSQKCSKVSVDFVVEKDLSFPRVNIGKQFSFSGNLNNVGDVSFTGETFVLKANSLKKILSGSNSSLCVMADDEADTEKSDFQGKCKNNSMKKRKDNRKIQRNCVSAYKTAMDKKKKSKVETNDDDNKVEETEKTKMSTELETLKNIEETKMSTEPETLKNIEDSNKEEENEFEDFKVNQEMQIGKENNKEDSKNTIDFTSDMEDSKLDDDETENSNEIESEITTRESEIRNLSFIPGVVTLSFVDNIPVKYTILNLIQYITKKWDQKTLQKDVEALNITHLYTIGATQNYLVKKEVKNIPVYKWRRPDYLPLKCPEHHIFGCTLYKSKCVMHDIIFTYQNNSFSCEEFNFY